MTVVVDRKLSKKEIDAIFKKMKSSPKLLDATKYFGKVKIKGDFLEIQRKMRDE